MLEKKDSYIKNLYKNIKGVIVNSNRSYYNNKIAVCGHYIPEYTRDCNKVECVWERS